MKICFTKSQLTDIWKKAVGKKTIKLIKNKDGSVEYNGKKMSGNFKGMTDKEIINMFLDTPY